MKALTLTQPYAAGVMLEIKQFETRSWRTKHRGPLAIHASRRFPEAAQEFAIEEMDAGAMPRMAISTGVVLCVVNVLDCVPVERLINPSLLADVTISDTERRWGNYAPGRWAWRLEVVKVFREPIVAIGRLGLWDWPEEYIDILGHESDRGWRPSDWPAIEKVLA